MPAHSSSFRTALVHRIVQFVTDFLDDFTEEPLEHQEIVPEDPLTVKKYVYPSAVEQDHYSESSDL